MDRKVSKKNWQAEINAEFELKLKINFLSKC